MPKPSRDLKTLFGRRVRQLRTARGYSQEGFALEFGINRTYYGAVERGEMNVCLETIGILAEAFGVTPSEILRFDRLGRS